MDLGGGDTDIQTVTDGHSPRKGNKEPPTSDEQGGSGTRSYDLGKEGTHTPGVKEGLLPFFRGPFPGLLTSSAIPGLSEKA